MIFEDDFLEVILIKSYIKNRLSIRATVLLLFFPLPPPLLSLEVGCSSSKSFWSQSSAYDIDDSTLLFMLLDLRLPSSRTTATVSILMSWIIIDITLSNDKIYWVSDGALSRLLRRYWRTSTCNVWILGPWLLFKMQFHRTVDYVGLFAHDRF